MSEQRQEATIYIPGLGTRYLATTGQPDSKPDQDDVIPAVTSLPEQAEVGDIVFLTTDKHLYIWVE